MGCCQVVWGAVIFGCGRESTERCSGCRDPRGDLIPHLESVGYFGAVVGGGHPVTGRSEVWGDATERGQKPLRCTDGPEPFLCPFELPGRLMGVLGPIIQIFRLPVLDRRHAGAVRDLVAGELVGDQHPRRVTLVFEEYAEEPGRGRTVSLGLDWIRISRTFPCWSTARHKYFRTPSILTNTSSRCHLSPGHAAACGRTGARTGCTRRGSSRMTPLFHVRT